MSTHDEGFKEVKPNNVAFSKPDDFIKGTYIDKFVPNQPDQYGNIKPAYSIIVEEALFHEKDGTKIEPQAGDIWRVWGGKPAVDNGFKQAKFGQKIIVKLTELRPTKKGNDAKIMKVLIGGMDQEWLKEKAVGGATNDADFESL